jgi:hypothetical protein
VLYNFSRNIDLEWVSIMKWISIHKWKSKRRYRQG